MWLAFVTHEMRRSVLGDQEFEIVKLGRTLVEVDVRIAEQKVVWIRGTDGPSVEWFSAEGDDFVVEFGTIFRRCLIVMPRHRRIPEMSGGRICAQPASREAPRDAQRIRIDITLDREDVRLAIEVLIREDRAALETSGRVGDEGIAGPGASECLSVEPDHTDILRSLMLGSAESPIPDR